MTDDRFAPTHAVRCLKQAGARSVWLVVRPGESPRTVKAWPLTPLFALKLLLGQSQPQRHRRGARLLNAAGIRTPELRGGPRIVRRGGRLLVELELEHAAGELALDALRAATKGEARAEAGTELRAQMRDALDRLLDRLGRARLLNRDLKLSNVLFVPATTVDAKAAHPGSLDVVLLDPVGVRRTRSTHAARARHEERLRVEDPAAWDRLRADSL